MRNPVTAPTEGAGAEPKNRLFAALPDEYLRSLRPHLKSVSLAPDSVLYDLSQPLTRLHFVESGVASLLTAVDNRAIGVAMVGREGIVEVHALLGGDSALAQCEVLVPGSALAVEVSAFQDALRASPELRAACESYTRALFAQILQAVPCNRLHSAEQRCARWLLTCADRTVSDTFELARRGLARMLGVAPPTLSIVIRKLQSGRLICCRRNAITVLDRHGLETVACECYRIVRRRCEGLPICDLN